MCSVNNETFDIEFIQRTLGNINAKGRPPYQITMLVNCLLGLVVLPFEMDVSNRRKIKLFNKNIVDVPIIKELTKDEYFHPTSYDRAQGRFKSKPLTIYNLLKCIRNSIAHHRIYCLPEDGKWRSVRLYDIQDKYTQDNVNGGKPHLELEIVWTIKQLRAFCDFVCEAYLFEAHSRPDVRLVPLDAWRD